MVEKRFTHDGKEYIVRKPNGSLINEADKIRSSVFSEHFLGNTLMKKQVQAELKRRGAWTEEMTQEYETLKAELIDLNKRLDKGGIKLSEARNIAIDMSQKRNAMIRLLSVTNELNSETCEGKADAARFNFLFVKSFFRADGSLVYDNVDDYISNGDSELALEGVNAFYNLMYNGDDIDNNLPENKFLKKYKFVDEQFRLIDKQGRLVDREGRHVNDEGRYIKWTSDTEYVFCDIHGELLTNDESLPFLDDDGKPISTDVVVTEEKAEVVE